MVSLDKIKRLGDAGEYDRCSGTECKSIMNQSLKSVVYPAVTGGGKCINLFKTLMSDNCVHDCKYCVNRCSRGREAYAPRELAETFFNMKRLGYVDGLFLSSGVAGDPDIIMSQMIESVSLIRKNFNGYVHLKVLPGTSKPIIKQACELADRVSINIESTNINELSSGKDFNSLMTRLAWISGYHRDVTTQLIVGGAGESDSEILKLVSKVYDSFRLKRVYFSSFTPVKGTPLESKARVNPLRSHRLYQTDYLLRQYGFRINEIPLSEGFLNVYQDPKLLYAVNNDLRVDVNNAKESELLRVPGIGPKTVKRIIGKHFKSLSELKKLGVITSRAAPFISINGCAQSRLNQLLEHPQSVSLAS